MPVRRPVPYSSSPPDYPTFKREPSVLEMAARQLAPQELSIFQEGLYDYEKRHNLEAFVKCLDYVLNTTQKRQLIFPILNSVIRPSDRAKFSQLLIRYGLAVPAQQESHTPRKGSPVKRSQWSPSSGSPPPKAQLKKVQIKQDTSGEWGFDIRGGSEHGVGVYVSWVDPGSAADRAGVKPGDQIVKANGTSFDTITHYDAVELIRSASKLKLTISSQGMLPMDHSLTPHVYRWVDPHGRPCTPPPERHLMLSRSPSGQLDPRVYQEPDVQKVNLFLQMGDGYGLSIRGGIEHGLGIYVSFVEPGSMAAINGVKMGDQILEVNNINFLAITHDDAAKILKSSQMLVMTVRHISKLPHSKLPQYGQTQWQRMSPERKLPEDVPEQRPKEPTRTMFAKGVGTQVMHKKQRMGQTSARHMMLELARSLLSHSEWKTFSYYLDQYDSEKIGVDDFVTALLRLLDTDEKKGLLSEVRPVIAARDLDRFNELTVHAEIAARNRMATGGGSKDSLGASSTSSGPPDDIIPGLSENFTMKSKTGKQAGMYTVQGSNSEGDSSPYPAVKVTNYNVNNNSVSLTSNTGQPDLMLLEGDATLTPTKALKVDSSVARSKKTAAKPSGTPIFRAPPPPSTPPTQHKRPTASPQLEAGGGNTSTPQGNESPDPKGMLTNTLQERRKRVNPGSFVKKPGDTHEETWEETWNETTLSTIHPTGHSRQETPPGPKAQEHVNGATDDEPQFMGMHRHGDSDSAAGRGLSMEEVRAMEEQITREAEERARREFQELLSREREDLLQKQEEERSRWLDEERSRWQEEERSRWQEEERSRLQEMDRVRREQEVARMEEEEQERIALEEQIRQEAHESVKKQYETLLKQETEERARLAAEVEARRAAEERLEAQLRSEEEERARRAEEDKQSQEAEQRKWEVEWARLEEEKLHLKEQQQREEVARREAQARRDAEQETERMRQVAEEQRVNEERRQEEERLRHLENEQRQKEESDRTLERQRRQEAADQQAREEAQRQAAEDSRREQEETERRQREEAERRQREEAERRQREEAERRQREEAERRQREETERKEREARQQTQTERAGLVVRREKVKLGDGSPKPGGGRAQPAVKGVREDVARAVAVAQDRTKYNELLSRRLGKKPETGNRSFKEFTNLKGEVLTVEIRKTTKRLGIAIVGGSDSKIKVIKIKEITPGCCAALTGVGLRVGQQILSVNDKSLFNLQHKEGAIAIKNAFDGTDKVMKLTVLDPSDD